MIMTFRETASQDAQELKNIAYRVIRTNYSSFLGAEAVNEFIDSGMSDKEIDDGLNCCTLMETEGVIIGFAIAYGELLHLIMIDVPYQGKGYGGTLLKYVEDRMFEKYDKISLQTFEENTATAQFYLKKGWLVAKKRQVYDMGKTMLVFSKQSTESARCCKSCMQI